MTKIAKVSACGIVAGPCLALLGLWLVDFGSCGPRHPKAFALVLLGGVVFAASIVGFSVWALKAISHRQKRVEERNA